MAKHPAGSLTKEFPLANIDRTIQAITPGMGFEDLRVWAEANTNGAIPPLLRNRFLLVRDHRVVYDEFLSIAAAEGLRASRVRKVMYFVWAYRDDRIRRFICECLANKQGRWRSTEVVRKSNADFFTAFLSADTAPKARSNYERFLVESGIFDERTRTVKLDLGDDWLADAARVAAQHEPNKLRHRALLGNPGELLIANNWHALADATPEMLRGLPPVVSASPDPLEDAPLGRSTMRPAAGRPWNRPRPSPGARRAASVTTDPVALERANLAHHRLEEIMAAAVRALNREPLFNEHMDMYVVSGGPSILAEMKSCQRNNLHAQVRRGISQLLEYRYVYRDLLGAQVTLLLVLETRPAADQMWLLEFAMTLGIVIAWKEASTDRIVSTAALPPALTGLVHSVA
jgi:hypothetical protein